MSDTLTVFVNGKTTVLPAGSSVGDAIRAADPAAADEVAAGTRAVVDSRGLPVTVETPLAGGFVMRIVSARALRDAEQ